MDSIKAQSIFDQVCHHLIKQGRPSYTMTHTSGVLCRYRSKAGYKCAIGPLISDDEYSSRLEGFRVGNIFSEFPDLEFSKNYKEFYALLHSLQDAHDMKAMVFETYYSNGVYKKDQYLEDLEDSLIEIADEFGLEYKKELYYE